MMRPTVNLAAVSLAAVSLTVSVLVLTGCSAAADDMPGDQARPLDAVRVAFPAQTAPQGPSTAGPPDAKAVWSGTPTDAALGFPGHAPLLSISCRGGQLAITRHAPADPGGQALFAMIGNGAILRLPVNATRQAGTDGLVWQGSLPATSTAADVFLRGAIAATLPGAGKISLPQSAVVQNLIRTCRGMAEGKPAATPSVKSGPV